MTSSLNVLKQLLQEEKFDEALNLVYSLCQFYENKFIKNLYDAIKQRNVTLACYFIDNYFKEFKPITHKNTIVSINESKDRSRKTNCTI